MFFEGFVGLWHSKNSESIDVFKTQMCFKKMIACSLKKGNDPPSAFPPAPLLGSFRQMPAVAHLTQFLLSGNRNAWIMEPMPSWVSLVSRVGLEKIISRYLRKEPWLEFKNSRMNWVVRATVASHTHRRRFSSIYCQIFLLLNQSCLITCSQHTCN